MRIIHLSDIHLSYDNIEDFRNYYKEAFIKELESINAQKNIDLIIISGDLVDKGGVSLKKIEGYENIENCYEIFEEEFLKPICENIPNMTGRILFIAGNHDIQQDKIDKVQEAGIKSILSNPKSVNDLYREYKENLNGLNFQRMQDYLDFEKRYQHNNQKLEYKFSDFESTAIYQYNEHKVGIALINDAWRCGKDSVSNHFLGTNQFHRCLLYFKENNTNLDIAVMHHPLDCYNKNEKQEIENILHSRGFSMVLLGHEHSQSFEEIGTGQPNSKIIYIRGRSAFDKPYEKEDKYISGFTIIDVDFNRKNLRCHYMKYDKSSFRFVDNIYGGSCIRECSLGITEVIKDKLVDSNKNNFQSSFDKELLYQIKKDMLCTNQDI